MRRRKRQEFPKIFRRAPRSVRADDAITESDESDDRNATRDGRSGVPSGPSADHPARSGPAPFRCGPLRIPSRVRPEESVAGGSDPVADGSSGPLDGSFAAPDGSFAAPNGPFAAPSGSRSGPRGPFFGRFGRVLAPGGSLWQVFGDWRLERPGGATVTIATTAQPQMAIPERPRNADPLRLGWAAPHRSDPGPGLVHPEAPGRVRPTRCGEIACSAESRLLRPSCPQDRPDEVGSPAHFPTLPTYSMYQVCKFCAASLEKDGRNSSQRTFGKHVTAYPIFSKYSTDGDHEGRAT